MTALYEEIEYFRAQFEKNTEKKSTILKIT